MDLEELRITLSLKAKPGYLFSQGERIGSSGVVVGKLGNHLEVGLYQGTFKIFGSKDTSITPIKELYLVNDENT
jgi:hypothetical protein